MAVAMARRRRWGRREVSEAMLLAHIDHRNPTFSGSSRVDGAQSTHDGTKALPDVHDTGKDLPQTMYDFSMLNC